jgi:hypothetical protein
MLIEHRGKACGSISVLTSPHPVRLHRGGCSSSRQQDFGLATAPVLVENALVRDWAEHTSVGALTCS